jgi:NAD-dependent DNA ligase
LDSLPVYEAWRKEQLPQIPYPVPAQQQQQQQPQTTKQEVFCMTGFRSSEMEAELKAKGHEISPTLTKKVSVLIVASPAMLNEPNEKVKKAKENGIRILTRDQTETTFLK